MSEPFYSKALNLVWRAPSSHLPATVRVLNVVPSQYSPTVISNLMLLGGFADRDQVKAFAPEYPLPKGALAFLKDEERSLSIVPKFGRITYRNPKAVAAMYPRAPVQDLPDDRESVRLALALLPSLGIDAMDLAAKADGTGPRFTIGSGSRGYRDKATGQYVKEEILRRVTFTRQLDGLDVVGGLRQGIHITFGNHGVVSELELDWRDVRSLGRFPTASVEQMFNWIREGRSRVQSTETTGGRWIQVSEIKRLTVTEVSLHYFAGTHDKPLEQLHPYALLKAEAELGEDDKETIWLFCPATAEGLPRPRRGNEGFSVYPSARYERRALTGEPTSK